MMGQNDENRPSVATNNNNNNSCSQNDGVVEYDDNHLEPFVHQVGGHGSVLTWDDRTVCKPYSSRERQFYEILPCEFKKFTPEFKGVIEVGLIEDSSGSLSLTAYKPKLKAHKKIHESSSSSSSLCKHRSMKIKLKRSGSLELVTDGSGGDVAFTDDCNGSSSAYQQNPWAMQCQRRHISKMQKKRDEKQQFLMLENLVSNFNFPCILDLKMGVRQYGDDASEAKRKSQALKCQASTSSILGLRMCGMQVYHTKSGVFKCHNKYYGRTLTVEGLKQEVCQFWDNGITFRLDLLLPCLAKLKALREIILKMNSYRFYSSSLLVIYDGDDSSSSVDVRMIDFEHSTCAGFRTDPSHDGVDQGYIMGLNSLIEILTDLHLQSTDVNDVIASSTPTLATSDTSSSTKSSAA